MTDSGKVILSLSPINAIFSRKAHSYIVMKGGRVQPDPKKIEAVQRIPVPTCVGDFSLASYYRRFIRNFAAIAKPLREAMCKDVKFQWTPEMQATLNL